MIPIVYSVTDTRRNKKGIMFVNSYSEAMRKIEESSDGLIDVYLTSVSGEDIELSDEVYNKLLDGSSV